MFRGGCELNMALVLLYFLFLCAVWCHTLAEETLFSFLGNYFETSVLLNARWKGKLTTIKDIAGAAVQSNEGLFSFWSLVHPIWPSMNWQTLDRPNQRLSLHPNWHSFICETLSNLNLNLEIEDGWQFWKGPHPWIAVVSKPTNKELAGTLSLVPTRHQD